jgi:ribosome-associated protein
MQEHADCDAQHLRSLVRAARREAALPLEQRNPRSHRELFQFIRPLLSETAA